MINTFKTRVCDYITQTVRYQQKYISHRYISMQRERILLVDPFYGGSHKQLTDLLYEKIPGCLKITMTPKKWHWRARMAALHFSRTIPFSDNYEILFSSSVLNLAELVALRPDLSRLQKILYFHENQLVYPKQEEKLRDVQYGYNQILSCLVADKVVFNSGYNMESFLSNIDKFFKIMPDYRPKGIAELIRPKCRVLYFPLNIQTVHKRAKSHTEDYGGLSSETILNGDCKIHHQNLMDKYLSQNVSVTQIGFSASNHGQEYTSKPVSSVSDNKNLIAEAKWYKDFKSHMPNQMAMSVCDNSNHGNNQIPDDNNMKTILSNAGVLKFQDYSGHVSKDSKNMKSSISVISNESDGGNSQKDTKMQPCSDQNVDLFLTDTEGINTENKCVKPKQGDIISHTVPENNLPQNNHLSKNDDSLKDKLERNSSKIQNISNNGNDPQKPLHLVWAHRWEFDKDPETLFEVVIKLFDAGIPFTLSVMGEQYTEVPDVFADAKQKLSSVIKAWGYQDNKEDYYDILADADVVLSTAKHEFFGVAMLEAVYFGCYPLCPNRLVYPEIFPKTYLYNTPAQLYKKLKNLCIRPHLVRNHQCQVTVDKYLWENCHGHFTELFNTKK